MLGYRKDMAQKKGSEAPKDDHTTPMGPVSAVNSAERISLALSMLVDGDVDTERDVYEHVARSAAIAFGYKYAMVGGLQPDGMVSVKAFWADGDFQEIPDYALKKTPCYDVYFSGDVCEFHDVAESFPEDQDLLDMNACVYRGRVIRGADGEVFGHISVISDVPDPPDAELDNHVLSSLARWCEREMVKLRMVGDVQRALERAEAASRVKTELLANVSHELRTPLNAIIGFSEAMRSGFVKTDETRLKEYSGYILNSGYHLLALVDDLLAIGSDEDRPPQANIEFIDPGTVLRGCTRMVEQAAQENDVTLQVHVPEAPLMMLGDHRMVRQVMLNLLTNAIKYTQSGGHVRAAIIDRSADGLIAISIEDNGIGIPEHKLEEIFEPFSRSENARRLAVEGLGLGLAISKQLMSIMGGDLTISSEEGKGTVTVMTLPMARD